MMILLLNLNIVVNGLDWNLKAYDMIIEAKTSVEKGSMFIFEDA